MEKHPELYPVSAQWWDSKDVQSYMANPEAGAKYTGPRQATRNFSQKRDEDVRKALKDLEPSITTRVTPSGQYEYVYDKSTMITPEQIQATVDGVINSNPEYQKSLQIDGAYTYKDQTPIDLASNLISSATTATKNLKELEAQIQAYRDKNPNISTEQAQQLDDQLASAKLHYTNEASSYTKLATALSSNDPSQIEYAKQALYRNNIMQGYVANFKMEQTDREIKENINATTTEEFTIKYLNAGLDPETKAPPLPGSKYYNHLQTMKKGKGEGTSDFSQSTIPLPGAANAKNNIQGLDESIAAIDANIKTLDNEFIMSHMAKYGVDENAAKAYINQQQQNIRDGKPVDADFLSYNKQKEGFNNKAYAYGSVKVEAERVAQAAAPVKNLGVKRIDGLSFAVDYTGNNDFANLVSRVEADISTKVDPVIDTAAGIRMATDRIAKEELNKYANNPNFKFLKEIVEKGFSKYSDEILKPVRTQVSEQNKLRDDFIKAKTNTITPTGKILVAKSEEEKAASSTVEAAITAEASLTGKQGEIPQNIVASTVYVDPVTNETKIDYVSGPEKERVSSTIIVPSGSSLTFLPKASVYDDIRTTIKLSTDHKTLPITTSNGKVTYKMGQNSFGSSNDYYVQIQLNGKWFPVPRMNRPDIGSLYEALEQASKNPLLNGLTPAEAAKLTIDKLNEEK